MLNIGLLAPGAVKTQIFRDDPTQASGAFVSQMLAMTEEHGLTPDAFAHRVFAAIDRGEYWIIPQPESFDPGFEARNAIILAREQPRFYLVDAGNTTPLATVDHTENRALFWASAAEVLEKADKGEVKIIFPTRRNLERLAMFGDFDSAAAHAAAHPVSTVLTYIDKREDGNWLCIPDGHGYPVLQESLDQAMRG